MATLLPEIRSQGIQQASEGKKRWPAVQLAPEASTLLVCVSSQPDDKIIFRPSGCQKMSSKRKEADAINFDDCWKVIERAAASAQLKRAARSREFLIYVSTKALKEGMSSDIHEQEIGHAIFGRSEDYDTSQDNIVRVSATDLRKRIEGYFSSEGADEPLIFEIPRGSYSPVFRWRVKGVQEEEPAKSSGVSAHSAPVPYYRQIPFLLVSALAILLAAGCALLWHQNAKLAIAQNMLAGKPALTRLWSHFLSAPLQTDVVLPDTSYGLLENITNQPFTLNEYLNNSYLAKLQSTNLSADRKADLAMIMEREHASVGDFRTVQRIWALDPTSSKLSLEYARESTPQIRSNATT